MNISDTLFMFYSLLSFRTDVYQRAIYAYPKRIPKASRRMIEKIINLVISKK